MISKFDGQRPARILVVDHNPTILRLLQFQLFGAGYNVDVAIKGSVALDRARAFDPDAILLDLDLPDISSLEVLNRLRDGDGSRRRVIVVLSDNPDYCLPIQLGGADSVESKPIAPSTLMRRLKSLHVPPRVKETSSARVALHAC